MDSTTAAQLISPLVAENIRTSPVRASFNPSLPAAAAASSLFFFLVVSQSVPSSLIPCPSDVLLLACLLTYLSAPFTASRHYTDIPSSRTQHQNPNPDPRTDIPNPWPRSRNPRPLSMAGLPLLYHRIYPRHPRHRHKRTPQSRDTGHGGGVF